MTILYLSVCSLCKLIKKVEERYTGLFIKQIQKDMPIYIRYTLVMFNIFLSEPKLIKQNGISWNKGM